MTRVSPKRRLWPALLALGICIATFSPHLGNAQGSSDAAAWELRVCADPAAYPASSIDLTGYENRIAEILADELGARLTYEWSQITNATVQSLLKRGSCDAVMSAGEGAMDLLNTVAYQRINNVFLYLAESNVSVGSLFDEGLADYRIGVMPNTSMHAVLFDLGLSNNYVGIQPDASKRGADRIRPMVDALRDGRIDVAIVSGALASAYVQAPDSEFAMSVVSPELVPPLTPTFHLATIGVRARDEGLRDALNVALARRWDEVQTVFADMAIPLLHSPPVIASEPSEGVVKIGVVAPFPTGFPDRLDAVGESAYFGAKLADDLALRGEGRQGESLHIVYASAPSAAAAKRAVDRMIAWHGVSGVVVAHDDTVTETVMAAVASADVPVLNAFATRDSLRDATCYPTTFHVAPSDTMYADALAHQATLEGVTDARIVHDGEARTMETVEAVRAALTDRDVVTTDVNVGTTLAFTVSAMSEVLSNDPGSLFIVLAPDAQLMMLQELDREGYGGLVIGFPWPEMQTREYYFRVIQDAPGAIRTPRVGGWEATVSAHGADELNLRYSSRSAKVMDVTAWATYAAVELLMEAALPTDEDTIVEPSDLTEAATGASLYRSDLSFDLENQLLQPLYYVALDPAATWSEAVSGRTSVASLVGEYVPRDVSDPREPVPCTP